MRRVRLRCLSEISQPYDGSEVGEVRTLQSWKGGAWPLKPTRRPSSLQPNGRVKLCCCPLGDARFLFFRLRLQNGRGDIGSFLPSSGLTSTSYSPGRVKEGGEAQSTPLLSLFGPCWQSGTGHRCHGLARRLMFLALGFGTFSSPCSGEDKGLLFTNITYLDSFQWSLGSHSPRE